MAFLPNTLITPTYVKIKRDALALSYDNKAISTPGIDLASWITNSLGSGVIQLPIGGGLTDHYVDTGSATYYYYGYNRYGEWEMKRNLKTDVNQENTATEILNPAVTTLAGAITNRVTLVYDGP